jgi:hypothetical protein
MLARMELTIWDVIGHLSYVFLVAASFFRTFMLLRVLAISAGLCGISYSYWGIHDPVDLMWEVIFTSVNIGQLVLLVREQRSINLTDEEIALRATHFKHMSLLDFNRFVRAGTWVSAEIGSNLTQQGHAVTRILLISDGAAEVEINGEVVAYLHHGDFVGEMAFVSGKPATATVSTIAPTRYIMWKFSDLRSLLEKYPDIRAALQNVFNQNLIDKLMREPVVDHSRAV